MASEPAKILFTFVGEVQPPDPEEEPEDTGTPTLIVDISGVDADLKLIMHKIIGLIEIEAINRGAELLFEIRDIPL